MALATVFKDKMCILKEIHPQVHGVPQRSDFCCVKFADVNCEFRAKIESET